MILKNTPYFAVTSSIVYNKRSFFCSTVEKLLYINIYIHILASMNDAAAKQLKIPCKNSILLCLYCYRKDKICLQILLIFVAD